MSTAKNTPTREEETLEVGVDESTYVQLEAAAARNDESTEEAAEAVLRQAAGGSLPSSTSIRYELYGLAVSALAFWVVGLAWVANTRGVPMMSDAMVPTVESLLPMALLLSGAVGVVSAIACTIGLPAPANR